MEPIAEKAPAAEVPAAGKAEPRCRHFGDCGGCQLQDLEYPDQLKRKSALVSELLQPLLWTRAIPIHPSPDLWYYRNKMEFSFQDVYPVPADGEDHLLLGLKRKNRWDKVMNLEECHLLSPEAPKLLAGAHAWARAEKLEPYNLHRQRGFLRHLVVREGKETGDRMVLLLTGPGDLPRQSFIDAVKSSYPATTVLWGINEGKADVAKSDRLEILTGPGTIEDVVLGRKFRLSPYSFFQTNTRGAAALYSRVREIVQGLSPKNVLDLYCGSGGISLCVADLCERVMGVEVIASAVEDARHNAVENKAANAEFMQSKVEDILPALAPRGLDVDVVVLDPPRSGLHPAAVKSLIDMAAPWVVYVSCNPKAMAADMKRLSHDYELKQVEAMDLFPHTEHVEAVALLKSLW